jgi:hypothetical protein
MRGRCAAEGLRIQGEKGEARSCKHCDNRRHIDVVFTERYLRCNHQE